MFDKQERVYRAVARPWPGLVKLDKEIICQSGASRLLYPPFKSALQFNILRLLT
ncbi:hypothetical protein [Endozoicomonas sp. ALE010]|uniref:hypothetical protein n=1 Tax=Endozoicomonas sp. ALE010 TaxID=3403081 RepID=UPI003BB7883C